MDWQPKVGEYARTRDGRKAFVSAILTNPFGNAGTYPVRGFVEQASDGFLFSWTRDGLSNPQGPQHCSDLVGPWVEPVDVPVTVVLYCNESWYCGAGHVHPSEYGIANFKGYKHATISVKPGDKG